MADASYAPKTYRKQGGDELIVASGGVIRVESGGTLAAGLTSVDAGSALTVTEADHNGRVIKLDTAAGSTCTLPAATGSGARFLFVVTLLATSNSHIVKVANASDTMIGIMLVESDDAADVAKAFVGSGTADTITLNRTTTGSVALGEWIECVDIAENLWWVRGVTAATGTEATPFSAAVS